MIFLCFIWVKKIILSNAVFDGDILSDIMLHHRMYKKSVVILVCLFLHNFSKHILYQFRLLEVFPGRLRIQNVKLVFENLLVFCNIANYLVCKKFRSWV